MTAIMVVAPPRPITRMTPVITVKAGVLLRLRNADRMSCMIENPLLRERYGKLILRIDNNHFRLHRLVGEGEGGDDDTIARHEVARGGAVDDDFAGSGGERNRIGLDTRAAADVPHGDLL